MTLKGDFNYGRAVSENSIHARQSRWKKLSRRWYADVTSWKPIQLLFVTRSCQRRQ